jgi:hypothetical protein
MHFIDAEEVSDAELRIMKEGTSLRESEGDRFGGCEVSGGAEDTALQKIVTLDGRVGRGLAMTQSAWMSAAVTGLEGAGVDGKISSHDES